MSRNFDLSQAANDGVTVLPDLTALTPAPGEVLTVASVTAGQVFTTFAPSTTGTGTFLPLAGGTLTGPLVLAADPANPLEAATKAYTDTKISTLPAPPAGAATLPLMDSTPALTGVSGAYARADHQHPSDTSRLSLTGGTLTGPLTLNADPTTSLQAATKQYVDTKVSSTPSGATLTVADSPPALTQGALWFDSVSTQLFVGYVDPTGPGQWVIATNPGAMLAGAYLPLSGGTLTGPLTLPGDAVSTLHAVPLQQLTASLTAYAPLASPPLTGNPTAPTPAAGDNDTSIATTAFVQTAVAPTQNNVGRNRLHNVRFGINQRNYVSGTVLAAGAYAHDRWKAGASGCTYTFTQSQPSTTITITAGSLQQIVEAMAVEGGTYTLSWTGTAQGRVNAGAYGASPVTVAGLAVNTAITVEFNTGTLTGVQLEIGSVATPLDYGGTPQQQLAQCQRFYCTGYIQLAGYTLGGSGIAYRSSFPVTMRTIPTITPNFSTNVNVSGAAMGASADGYQLYGNGTSTATFNLAGTYTASADL